MPMKVTPAPLWTALLEGNPHAVLEGLESGPMLSEHIKVIFMFDRNIPLQWRT